MVNTRLNDVRPVASINASVKKSAPRVHDQGWGKIIPRSKGRKRVAPIRDGTPMENYPMNENPPGIIKR